MKVILIRDVEGLGERGSVVSVARGFARNYLFPRNLAKQATERILSAYERETSGRTAAGTRAAYC